MEFSCLIEKKITTTPLLDFLRQRKADRQRLRDERREERRRKEQERKRLKDADRDRRRGTVKPDTGSRNTASDSVLKVRFSQQKAGIWYHHVHTCHFMFLSTTNNFWAIWYIFVIGTLWHWSLVSFSTFWLLMLNNNEAVVQTCEMRAEYKMTSQLYRIGV